MKTDKKERTNIENLFHLFSSAAMNARPYVAKKPVPATVTVRLDPDDMEILHIIAARIGAPRFNVAHHILKLGIHEAAYGCGFVVDKEGKISKDQLKWDTVPREMGFSHPGDDEEEA